MNENGNDPPPLLPSEEDRAKAVLAVTKYQQAKENISFATAQYIAVKTGRKKPPKTWLTQRKVFTRSLKL